MFAEIEFLEPPYGPYTYSIQSHEDLREVGIRVKVPFANTRRVGVLIKYHNILPDFQVKEILQAVDSSPIIDTDLLKLSEWLAGYYLCHLGEVLNAIIPRKLKPGRRFRYKLTESARKLPFMNEESGPTGDLFRELSSNALTLGQITNRVRHGEKILYKFIRDGIVERMEPVSSSLHRTVQQWTWNREVEYADSLQELPPRAVRIREVVEMFQARSGVVNANELRSVEPGLTPAIRSLKKRGLISEELVPFHQLSSSQSGLAETSTVVPELNSEQRNVLRKIISSLDAEKFDPFLLYGVTGSGKTLVYLAALEKALELGKSAIVMVPEISLTPQLMGRIYRKFGKRVAVSHSGLNETERRDVWALFNSGEAKIAVGPRSIVFAPLKNLGLIIVDEEHDESYKQHDPAPRYSGRDAAVYRGKITGSTVILGSATPDVISLFNTSLKRYSLLELKSRFGGGKDPEFNIVNWIPEKNGTLLSPELINGIENRLERNEQIIILLNRRAFANFLKCPSCGDVVSCPNCDVSLRYHQHENHLLCHYCGFKQRVSDTCTNCGGDRIRYFGAGTQRIEREIDFNFPNAVIARMDRDTTSKRGSHQRILEGFANGTTDILIGTQMVAKGHDFPNATLVGIISADYEWNRIDYKANERAFRLMLQAAGRTGRSSAGEVIVQTWNTEHRLLKWLKTGNYDKLYDREIISREKLSYPPFSRLVLIQVKSTDMNVAKQLTIELKRRLELISDRLVMLGPAPPAIARIEGQHILNILIKLPSRISKNVRSTKKEIAQIIDGIKKENLNKDMRIIIDVDPVEI